MPRKKEPKYAHEYISENEYWKRWHAGEDNETLPQVVREPSYKDPHIRIKDERVEIAGYCHASFPHRLTFPEAKRLWKIVTAMPVVEVSKSRRPDEKDSQVLHVVFADDWSCDYVATRRKTYLQVGCSRLRWKDLEKIIDALPPKKGKAHA